MQLITTQITCAPSDRQRTTPSSSPALKSDSCFIDELAGRLPGAVTGTVTNQRSKDYREMPCDRIFVAESWPAFRYSRQYVLRSSDLLRHDRCLSDHYMIKVSTKGYVDDADPR
jgi:hypothetical protein